jgi:hypothetical protein
VSRRFALHYLEMLVAMVAGMVVLGGLGDLLFDLPGGAAPMLVWMTVTMTVPMVAWMRFRGHGWRPCNEMAASMILPTVAMLALLAAGLVTDHGTLMLLEHALMLPSMLVAMLLRRDEYSGHHHHHRAEVTA